MKNFVTETEDVLFRAWKQIEHQLDNFDALKSFGILCIRMSLHLWGKSDLAHWHIFVIILQFFY